MSIPYAIAVAVGPDPQELERVADLIESVRAFETGACTFVMVDDGESDRKLASHFRFPSNWTPLSAPHPRRQFPERAAKAKRGKGICAAIQQGLKVVAEKALTASFTLKLDTDALVIGPFVEKLHRVVQTNPNAGMIGAYDKTPSGTPRDIGKNAGTVKSLHKGESLTRKIKNRIGNDERATIARHIDAAIDHGYRYGEHCLGGAYAVSRTLLSRMREAKYLEDPSLWLPIDCPEDVMVGIYTKAVGCDYLSYVGRDEVFGVRHRGLDDTPQGLLDRGYSVIHAVKNDAKVSEDKIRKFYREKRKSTV